MTWIAEWIARTLGMGSGSVFRILVTILIVIFLWLVRWLWIVVVNRRTEDPQLRYRWRKAAWYTVTLIGLVLVGRVWFAGVESLITYLGLVSAGIAIALRDPIVNWFGWIFIGSRRPFVIGDRIRMGDLSGDVIDMGMSTFSLLEASGQDAGEQSTGHIIHIPNGKVFVEPLTNVTQGFSYVWNEIPITVTFESDWRKAKTVLKEIARKHVEAVGVEAQQWIRDASAKFMIKLANVAPVVYTRIVSDGVELTVRYLCEARTRRITQEVVSEAILDAFIQAPNIDFAYRTSRIFRQAEEGKLGLNPKQDQPGGSS
jgi:small-conductance mechanosensitive channel